MFSWIQIVGHDGNPPSRFWVHSRADEMVFMTRETLYCPRAEAVPQSNESSTASCGRHKKQTEGEEA
jgi:hypothetical protein